MAILEPHALCPLRAQVTVLRDGGLDRGQQVSFAAGLRQKIDGARLDRAHAGRNIAGAGEKNNRGVILRV